MSLWNSPTVHAHAHGPSRIADSNSEDDIPQLESSSSTSSLSSALSAGPHRSAMYEIGPAEPSISLQLSGLPACCRRSLEKFVYAVDVSQLPSSLSSSFVLCGLDEAALAFLSHSILEHHSNPFPLSNPAFRRTTLGKMAMLSLCCVSRHLCLASCLRPWLMCCCRLAHTDANGLLGVGKMFVLSTEQIQRLMDAGDSKQRTGYTTVNGNVPSGVSTTQHPIGMTGGSTHGEEDGAAEHGNDERDSDESLRLLANSSSAHNSRRERFLLDIGAGDGNVTKEIARLCTSVTATEVSRPMVWRLRQHGYTVIRTANLLDVPLPLPSSLSSSSSPSSSVRGFHLISMFNVLDRCDRPLTLLQQIRRLLLPTGRLLLATPLPLNPSVESGGRWHRPKEDIRLNGGCCLSFEENLKHLVAIVEKEGFQLLSWTRVPYLSQGDSQKPFYTLDDVVLYLKADRHHIGNLTSNGSDKEK